MIRPVYSVYDKITKSYGVPIEFESHELAYASVRRQIRDMFFKGDINRDALNDNELHYIADFDTLSGQFIEATEDFKKIIPFVSLIDQEEM